MDDMKLVISEGGAAVDFSKATEMDFAAGNTGGGNQGGGSSDASAIYSNNFDKEISSKGSAGWPYCDEFDGWKNEAGTGAANVTYAFKSASARATSGSNNIWLPKAGGYFSVQDIALNGASSLELSFSVICGSPGNYKKTFDSNVFKVYLSSDKAKWVELPVTVTANGTEFDSAVATFSVPSNTANLSIVFEKISDESDGYRIDNINLISSTSAGTTIDFAQGVEKDFEEGSTSGGGNQGGGNTPVEGQPTNLIKATVAEFLAAEESSDVWYELTGEVTSIKEGNAYGNIYINDGTAEVYIYGLTNGWVGSNDKSFDSIGLKVGDTVTLGTLRGSYNGEPQGGGSKVPAFYISHVPGEGSGNEGGNEGGEDPVTPPAGGEGQYEPNITWTLGNKAYDKTSGSNAQTGTVNGVSVENMLKLGTSSLVGDATLHVPAGTKKLGFYCIAWKGKKANVKFSINGSEIGTVAPAANAGATGNPPYTITLADTDYYEVEMPSTEGGDVKVETLDNSNGRVIFIGLKAITE
jgi:hypothetical protein